MHREEIVHRAQFQIPLPKSSRASFAQKFMVFAGKCTVANELLAEPHYLKSANTTICRISNEPAIGAVFRGVKTAPLHESFLDKSYFIRAFMAGERIIPM